MVIDLFCKSVGELPQGPGAPDDRYGPRAPFDPSRSEKQQFALAASVVAPVFAVFDDDGNQTVVDATSPNSLHKEANGFLHALWRASSIRPRWTNDSADTCKRSLKGCATASRFSILECRRWGESARIIRSSRKPPLAGDKIRGNPNGGLGRTSAGVDYGANGRCTSQAAVEFRRR
jgi:hypothetical protein